MEQSKYSVGTKIIFMEEDSPIHGKVVENFKLPGDICIEWETGLITSYDEEWLDENVEVET